MNAPKLGTIVCGVTIVFLSACHQAALHDPIFDQYRSAICIPPSANLKATSPHTREWDTTLILHDGSKVRVSGAQMPGGRISMRDSSTGPALVIADAGDYIYPSDVRLNPNNDFLYVKASGLAAGIWNETWLFAYNIDKRQLVKRMKVANETLPAECPEVISAK